MVDTDLGFSDEVPCDRSFILALTDAVNVVSGKWKLAIVCVLLIGPKGFNEIERMLERISPRMLSRELRELELNGVVERREGQGTKGRHGRLYALTPSGEGLKDVVVMMTRWGHRHRRLQTASSSPDPAP